MTSAEQTTSRLRVCLWAIGPGAETVPVGQTVGDRYEVIAPQIWQDLTPEVPPQTPPSLPDVALPYLKAHPYRTHVPGIYDVVTQRGKAPWILLENVPINARAGQVFPTLQEVWTGASAFRQVSWLWQMWQLWEPLHALGVATSLLDLDNLRVEGWRVRLRQLIRDRAAPSLGDLAACWQPLSEIAQPSLITPLGNLCEGLSTGTLTAEQLTVDLNYLLLREAAPHRCRFRVAGNTDAGPTQARNEDACYPIGEQPAVPMPRIGIVCDGVGGHEAGEVASQIVVRSLQPQLQGLLAEAGREEYPVPPAVVAQQIEAAIRVVNDLINSQNDLQNRNDRQRMGTTLVAAIVVPQRLKTEKGWLQMEEVYIAHVGDSRAYWITPDYCHCLTVDDDIAAREVMAGRAFYTALRNRPEAGALTQAIGTRSSSHLTVHIQRFLPDEEGVLLLTSDGLSDNAQIENAWANYIGLITKGIISLQSAVQSWIDLANQKNGHDNVAVVLMHATPLLEAAQPEPTTPPAATTDSETDLTEASKVLLYGEEDANADLPAPEKVTLRRISKGWLVLLAAGILAFAVFLGWWVAGKLAPSYPEPGREETGELN